MCFDTNLLRYFSWNACPSVGPHVCVCVLFLFVSYSFDIDSQWLHLWLPSHKFQPAEVSLIAGWHLEFQSSQPLSGNRLQLLSLRVRGPNGAPFTLDSSDLADLRDGTEMPAWIIRKACMVISPIRYLRHRAARWDSCDVAHKYDNAGEQKWQWTKHLPFPLICMQKKYYILEKRGFSAEEYVISHTQEWLDLVLRFDTHQKQKLTTQWVQLSTLPGFWVYVILPCHVFPDGGEWWQLLPFCFLTVEEDVAFRRALRCRALRQPSVLLLAWIRHEVASGRRI